jgi:hypothetical protein
METVEHFVRGPYILAKAAYPKVDPEVLQTLSEMIGIPPFVLTHWQVDPGIGQGSVFLTTLLQNDGLGWIPVGFIAVSLWVVIYTAIEQPSEAFFGAATVAAGIPMYWICSRFRQRSGARLRRDSESRGTL